MWEPLTALFTLVLASATVALAIRTGDTIRAEWRPVLVIKGISNAGGILPSITYSSDTLALAVQNVGRGPALGIAALTDFGTQLRPGEPLASIVEPDGVEVFKWNVELEPDTYSIQGWLEYRDVSEATYTTAFRFDLDLTPERIEPVLVQHFSRVPDVIPNWLQRILPNLLVRHIVRTRLRRLTTKVAESRKPADPTA